MNIKMTIYEGNNTINVADYTPTVTLTVVDNLYQSGGGGGAVDSVNGKTGVVVLGANDIAESATLFWLTDALKSAYNQAVTTANSCASWISSNGTNLLNHLSNTSNPHSVTASQVGLGNVNNTSDANKPISTATQTALDLKANASDVAIVLFKSITQTIVTGKTAETSIYAIPLPMDGSNYMIRVYSQAQISTYAGSGNINHRLRVGTYSSVIDGSVGANSIGQQTVIAINGLSSANQFPITRNFKFIGNASGYIYGYSASTFAGDDANSTTPFSLLTSKDFTTQHYLYVTFNPSVIGAVILHNQILVTLIKI